MECGVLCCGVIDGIDMICGNHTYCMYLPIRRLNLIIHNYYR